MIVAKTMAEARHAIGSRRKRGDSIGFVPTMGALHAGHGALIEREAAENDAAIVSIFVNPLQFGPTEDLDSYPQSLDSDLAYCRKRGVAMVFCPSGREMYERPTHTRVTVKRLSDVLCGKQRPGHFDGVCTVVCKLLNIVAPDRAYFGEKDYQQLIIIRAMARDLNMHCEIVACPTVREPDGLAMSSRNAYLSDESRMQATAIYRSLVDAAGEIRAGQRDGAAVASRVYQQLESAGAESIDYVSVVDPSTLESIECIDRPVRICVAARFGGARLIDNIAVDVTATSS